MNNKKRIYKFIILIFLLIFVISIIILSYNGIFFFNEGFNDFDYLMMNVLGDAIVVGIVTHISTKNISTYISKKEFDRSNKIIIKINKSRNGIINYETFMDLYKNNVVYFAVNESDRKTIEYVYKLYDCFLNTLSCDGVEKQLLNTILNIPFFFTYFDDDKIEDTYEEIIKNFDQKKEFNNISILKKMLTKKEIEKLAQFSKIILNIKHYTITNLNNVEGCQIIITADNIVACKIPCLPNNTYDVFIYYDSDRWIDCLAFSFDYDSKEYATNILGFKYSNNNESLKSAKINLNDYIKIK